MSMRRAIPVGVIMVLALAASQAEAARLRYARPNAQGGVTAGTVSGYSGARGSMVRGRSVTTNGAGGATAVSGMAVHGAQGSSVQSSGSATRNADGTVSRSRTTNATNAVTGKTVNSSTSYSNSTGLTHSATCYDASGAVTACR